ncbi:MAG: AraC family transcriptional regulator [Spirochaetota bacterium]
MQTEYKTLISNSSLEILEVNNLSHVFPMHINRRICIGRIDSGTKVLFIDGKKIELKKDDLFIVPPYKVHMSYVDEASYSIICADDINQLYEGTNFDKKFHKAFKNGNFRSLISYYLKQSKYSYKKKYSKIDEILKYIDNNYTKQLTVDLLAHNIGLSPHYLLHLFKEVVGLSLHQYILQSRVKKFKERGMQQKDKMDVAFSCGFYDQSHLIRIFKKHVGITPNRYFDSVRMIKA